MCMCKLFFAEIDAQRCGWSAEGGGLLVVCTCIVYRFETCERSLVLYGGKKKWVCGGQGARLL